QPQFLTYREALREDRQAALGTDVHRIPLCAKGPAAFGPLNGHRYSGIQANSGADMLHPLLEFADDRRHGLLGLLLWMPLARKFRRKATTANQIRSDLRLRGGCP